MLMLIRCPQILLGIMLLSERGITANVTDCRSCVSTAQFDRSSFQFLTGPTGLRTQAASLRSSKDHHTDLNHCCSWSAVHQYIEDNNQQSLYRVCYRCDR